MVVSIGSVELPDMDTHHLEIVDLLSDLLGKQRRQAVASRDVPTAVVLATWPGVVKLDARIPVDVPPTNRLRGDRCALRTCAAVPASFRQEVIFTLNLHMFAWTRTRAARFIRGVGSTGMRRVTAVQCMGGRRDPEIGVCF